MSAAADKADREQERERARDSAPDDVVPESPRDAGVPVPTARIEDVEPERLLENEARDRLRADGFTDDQILRWAEAYYAEHTEGDTDDLVNWIRAQEGRAR